MNRIAAIVFAGFATFAWSQDVPFTESFDSLDTGALHSQRDWGSRRQNSAQVQETTVFAGARAATLSTNAVVWHSFTNANATNVWVDFYARAPYSDDNDEPSLTTSTAAAFYVGTDGKIRAISNSTWVVLNHVVPADTWQRFSIHLDYESEVWELHVAGSTPGALATPVATTLAFSASNTNSYFRGFRIRN